MKPQSMHSKKRSNSSKKSEPSSDPDPKSNPPIPPNPSPQSPHKNPNPKSSKTRSADKNPNPSSPNPKSSKTPKPSPPMAKDPAASSHRSRKEKRFKKQDPSDEDIPAAVVSDAVVSDAVVSAADSGDGEKVSQPGGRVWRDDDVIAILKGLIDFRSRFGGAPTASTIGAFFNSIKESLPPSITQDQLYTKLRRLRKKYNEIAANPDAFEDVPYHELLLEALGNDEKKPKILYADAKNVGVSTPKAKKAKVEPSGTNGKKPKADSESNGHVESVEEEDVDDSDADVNGNDGEVEEEEEEPEVGDVCALYPLVAKGVAESLEANRMSSTKEELERILRAIDPEEANALEGGFAEQYYDMMKLMAHRAQLTTRGCTFLSEVYNHKRKHT